MPCDAISPTKNNLIVGRCIGAVRRAAPSDQPADRATERPTDGPSANRDEHLSDELKIQKSLLPSIL